MSVTYASIDQLIASPFQRLTSAMWNTAVLLEIQLYQTGGNVVSKLLQNGNLYVPQNLFALGGFFNKEVYVAGQPVLTEQDPIYVAGFISLAEYQWNQLLYSNNQIYRALLQLPSQVAQAVASSSGSIVNGIYWGVKQQKEIYENTAYLLYQFPYVVGKLIKQQIIPLVNSIYYATQQQEEIYKQTAQLLYIIPSLISKLIQQNSYNLISSLMYILNYFYLSTIQFVNAINKMIMYLSPPVIEGLQLDVSTTPSPLYSGPAIKTAKIILQNLSNYIVYIGNNLYNNFPILPNDELEISVSDPSKVYAWATGPCKIYALFEVVSQS